MKKKVLSLSKLSLNKEVITTLKASNIKGGATVNSCNTCGNTCEVSNCIECQTGRCNTMFDPTCVGETCEAVSQCIACQSAGCPSADTFCPGCGIG